MSLLDLLIPNRRPDEMARKATELLDKAEDILGTDAQSCPHPSQLAWATAASSYAAARIAAAQYLRDTK